METTDKVTRYENSRFNHEQFARELEAIRKSKRIPNQTQLAEAIGVGREVITGIYTGKGIGFEQLCKIIVFSNLDLRDYLSEDGHKPSASQTVRMTED